MKIAQRVQALLNNVVKTYIIINTDQASQQLDWNGSVLQDESHLLHKQYDISEPALVSYQSGA